MNPIASLRNFTARVVASTRAVHEDIAGLRARIAELREARKIVQLAPVPLDEIHDRITTLVSDLGAKWIAEHGAELLHDPRPGWRAVGAYGGRGRFAVPIGVERDGFGFLCAADPDHARQMLDNVAELVPFEAGLTTPARPAELARLEHELADAEATEEATIDEAARAGVVVEHRPDVRQRREQERRARELEETRVADRARRQAALDADAAERDGRRPSVTSSYLANKPGPF